MSKFHNPYNFIPALDPAPGGEYKSTQPDVNALGQGSPAGHDRYHKPLWSGRIEIEIEAVTPLLVPEARPKRLTGNKNEHKVFRTRRRGTLNVNGQTVEAPLLPVTTFKGPLRTAYEAITNSRFGVFRGHGAPLARRMKPEEALQFIPGRIVRNSTGDLKVALLMGTTNDYPAWKPSRGNPKKKEWVLPAPGIAYAAWVPFGRSNPQNNFTLGGSGLQHSDPVSVQLQRVKRGAVSLWQVVRMAPGHGATAGFKDVPTADGRARRRGGNYQQQSDFHPSTTAEVNGWLCINNKNINNKHDERVFFCSGTPTRLPLSPAVQQAWTDLIRNYRAVYRRDGWTQQHSVPSRHLEERGAEKLKDGTLCYIKLRRKDEAVDPARSLERDSAGKPIVEAIYPVTISRELGTVAPVDMLPESLLPAERFDNLSPADRVFGWVRDLRANAPARKAAGRNDSGPAAWKGQLRIAPITCLGCNDAQGNVLPPIEVFGKNKNGNPRELPLAILSTPKPSQARFYAAKDKEGTPLPDGTLVGKAAYFDERGVATNYGLRGRKAYPHQPTVAGNADYWSPGKAIKEANTEDWFDKFQPGGAKGTIYREYIRRKGRKTGRDGKVTKIMTQDSQNRSFIDWIRPATKFETHIDVINLNKAELGALFWLLDLNANGRGPDAHLRLGGGKPLGFGSVKVTVKAIDVRCGADLKVYYSSLNGAASSTTFDRQDAVTAFTQALETAYGAPFEDVPFIAAFLAAAFGHQEGLSTHYPRQNSKPDPAGENFRWFVANERGRRRRDARPASGGRPAQSALPGRKPNRLALLALSEDRGLPIDPTDPE